MVKLSVFNSVADIKSRTIGILYKADPDPDLHLQKKRTTDLQKKRSLYQNSLYDLKFIFDKIEGVDFKYDNSFFKSQPKNTQIRHFVLKFLFLHKTLQQYKFKDTDFNFLNSSPKIPNQIFLVKNTQIRHFWFQIQKFLFFWRNFAVRQT